MLRAVYAARKTGGSKILVAARGLHHSAPTMAAQVFTMPAMSPTMSEGGIVSWKFKPGEAFNSGDVLLEVETDKATIDVEAVDDGKMWEIIINDGAKGVAVGEPIALLAEPEDDLSTLERPVLETKATKPTETAEAPKAVKAEEPVASKTPAAPKTSGSTEIFAQANVSQKLSPAVELLLHENDISVEDALGSIPASGPKGRLLKGDVLAHLGSISKDSIIKVTEFIKSREHLDLSNIVKADPAELKKKAEAAAPKPEAKAPAPEPVKPKNVLTVELTSALDGDISKEKFKYAFERSIEVAIRQTYGRKFPQYATSPVGSSLTAADDLFDDLLTPSVTKSRFEVYGINYKFFGPSLAAPSKAQSIASDFDELLGLTSSSPAYVEEGSAKVNVEFKIKFDEKLSDSKDFVSVFEDSLLSQIPANKLKISN
ncbi:hypothetical protein G9P44_001172 [Scheffersomyces stipitis]|nr:hypothetical protein G9P44_001172 [Scheffersomyces stipitis]